MFFNTATIYKATNTIGAAERYVAKWMPNRKDITIEFVGGQYLVVSK